VEPVFPTLVVYGVLEHLTLLAKIILQSAILSSTLATLPLEVLAH